MIAQNLKFQIVSVFSSLYTLNLRITTIYLNFHKERWNWQNNTVVQVILEFHLENIINQTMPCWRIKKWVLTENGSTMQTKHNLLWGSHRFFRFFRDFKVFTFCIFSQDNTRVTFASFCHQSYQKYFSFLKSWFKMADLS